MKKRKKSKLAQFIGYCEFQYKHMDQWVLWLTVALFGIGLLVIYSVTLDPRFNNPNAWEAGRYVMQQATFGVIGIIAMLVMVLIPHKWLRSKLFGAGSIALTLGLLLATLLFGQDGNDSNVSRWLEIGGFRFQPGEFARLGLIFAIAWMIYTMDAAKTYSVKWGTQKFKQFLISDRVRWQRKLKYLAGNQFAILAFVGLVAFMFIRQPDLGSGLTVLGVGGVMLLSSGIPKKFILFYSAIVIAGAVFAVFFGEMLPNHMGERFAIWRDPFSHPDGLQNTMGFRSISLGGLFGMGLGHGSPLIPWQGGGLTRSGLAIEAHTDFIIVILAEEMGFIWVLGVMVAYCAIALRCFYNALRAHDLFSAMFAIGTGALMLIQSFINLGGVSGLIPLTGITLPLLSFGGTSVVAILLMVGLYLNVSAEIARDRLNQAEVSINSKKAPKKVIPFLKTRKNPA
ncbi:MAG: FtsW/RodA/SpoVE family cell cycle protein [Turicibacter sp.]|nr:FtsW/RodA/SpoVE family cell cycle protein [Turicibacter sp.]